MKIVCIKDMAMEESGTVEFTKGFIYEATIQDGYIHATNNSGNTNHGIGFKKDKFFKKYFVKIKGENKAIELKADFEFKQEEELDELF